MVEVGWSIRMRDELEPALKASLKAKSCDSRAGVHAGDRSKSFGSTGVGGMGNRESLKRTDWVFRERALRGRTCGASPSRAECDAGDQRGGKSRR